MWILALEWLLLAFCVLWGIGAAKRLKRLRAQCKSAFATVEAQCAQVLDLQRSCARLQALKEQVTAVYVQHAQEVLLPSADVLQAALQQVRQHPLRPASIAALDHAWHGVQQAWQAYAQRCAAETAVHAEHAHDWSQRWLQLQALQTHSAAQFNAAVADYNRAIAQFPACVIARLGGHRATPTFQKDAAHWMQPTA